MSTYILHVHAICTADPLHLAAHLVFCVLRSDLSTTNCIQW